MKRLVFSTVEYTVEDGDTVEKVAARFDCTPSQLIKLNKLKSRILFIGQKISVPDGTTIEEVIEEKPRRLSEVAESSPEISVTPVDERRRPSETSAFERITATLPTSGDDDAECLLKFFKVHTERYLLDGSRAPGVFIVTPNCAMFDPDLEQDEKFDEIQEKFGVVAPLDDVFSISLFETKLDKITRNKTRFYEALRRVEKLQALQPVPSSEPSKYVYFLCMRMLDTRKKSETSVDNGPSGTKCQHVWFAIPVEKIDTLYLLFLQWCVTDRSSQGSNFDDVALIESSGGFVRNSIRDPLFAHEEEQKAVRFLVVDESQYAESPDAAEIPSLNPITALSSILQGASSDAGPQQQNLKLVWQLVKIDDFKHRFNLEGLTESYFLPLPEGSAQSQLLDESMIRHLMGVLPARAQSYPWVSIYSTRAHGFSLRTMYLKISQFNEETSPTLLVVEDSQHHVFGAVVSCQLRVADHFYGSGESLLFTSHPAFSIYRWTGRNGFVVKGSLDSLAIGSGRGTFGLYLDADLYHGRTQRCDTFNNEPPTEPADFTVIGVEVFGFAL